MTVKDLHRTALGRFSAVIEQVPGSAWSGPTPCADWDVRTLVNHVVGENRWLPPLAAGKAIVDVGDALDGDLLGDDPLKAWIASVEEAAAAASAVDLGATVHLSFGDVPAEEYLWQLTADALIHAWDLARATGLPEDLPSEVVEAVSAWFDQREELYRGAGAIGPAVRSDSDHAQDKLVARFGRNPSPDDTLAALVRFNRAFANKDLDAIGQAVTDDCRFIDTSPPDGILHEGREAVVSAFANLFEASPSAAFSTESGLVCGNRAVFQWRYDWQENGGGHVRGIDLFTVREGRVAEKASYVKG